MNLPLKPNQILYSLHILSSWSLPVHPLFSSVLLAQADSQHLPSFHTCAPTDRPSAVTMFVVKCYKSGPFTSAQTEQWWPSDDKEILILMDHSSSGWGRIGGIGGIGGVGGGFYQWVNSWQADYKSRAPARPWGFIGNPKDLWDQHWGDPQ